MGVIVVEPFKDEMLRLTGGVDVGPVFGGVGSGTRRRPALVSVKTIHSPM